MQIIEHSDYKAFDLKDEKGRVYVTAYGQPGTNSWTIRCPYMSSFVIAHGNSERQVRAFMSSLADAFNRHAESE